jgi:hypothetical protein
MGEYGVEQDGKIDKRDGGGRERRQGWWEGWCTGSCERQGFLYSESHASEEGKG